ncbi:GNAT family N-acetyltransferase [Niveibacterium sp.]|uniref:GNAT family N-acetyltransferase n=1 Tax=Niveibacterium sp. TaxID=2017444 RepID=UPI0035AFBC05
MAGFIALGASRPVAERVGNLLPHRPQRILGAIRLPHARVPQRHRCPRRLRRPHRINWTVPKCEVGYWGRVSHRKRGLITEAVRGITQFAFAQLRMRRVECLSDAENMASRAVAERAGFALEGVLRNERIAPDGTPRNTCVYSVTA